MLAHLYSYKLFWPINTQEYKHCFNPHHRRDELGGELQVAEVGELGGDEAQHGVLAVHVQTGDLGPEGHERPQAGVLG